MKIRFIFARGFIQKKNRITMELSMNVGFGQLVDLINRLPACQIAKIKNEFSDSDIASKAKAEILDFQRFILEGPVMSEEQYSNFKEQRKQFSLWRTH